MGNSSINIPAGVTLLIAFWAGVGVLPAEAQYRFKIEPSQKVRLKTDTHTVVFHYTDKEVKPRAGYTYYWMRQREVFSSEGNYAGKLLSGSYEAFHPEGQLKTKGKFELGLQEGRWSYWDLQGRLRTQIDFRSGLRHGDFLHVQGDTIERGRYRKGEKHGWFEQSKGDSLIRSIRYKHGKEVVVKEKKKRFRFEKWLKKQAADSLEFVPMQEQVDEASEEPTEKKRKLFKKKKDESAGSEDGTQKDKRDRKKKEEGANEEKEGFFKRLFRSRDREAANETDP